MINFPNDYQNAAVLAAEAANELMTRLDWVKLQPKLIADVGSGTGLLTNLLSERYPAAKIVALDHDEAIIKYSTTLIQPEVSAIVADGAALPLQDAKFDLICSNFLLPWYQDIAQLFREWRRIVRAEGLLIFSGLGPGSFAEWQALLPENHLALLDMHNIGDILVQTGFADPVLEVDDVTLSYSDPDKFLFELEVSGLLPLDKNIRAAWQQEANQRAQQDNLIITFEMVYGHAWAPEKKGYVQDESGVAKVPLSYLRKRLRGEG